MVLGGDVRCSDWNSPDIGWVPPCGLCTYVKHVCLLTILNHPLPYLCRPKAKKIMKFRRLTKEELQGLEGDFVQFLAANTVTAQDWERLKKEEVAKAEDLLNLFSDIVFEKIIKQVVYLEFRTPDDLKAFHCLDDKIVLNGLHMEGQATHDLTSDLPAAELMDSFKTANVQLKIYTAEKAYLPDREKEIFRMLETGALIAPQGQWFQTIEALKA
jgi:hypothetical protein